jgi:hypothetical protein
VNQAYRFGLTGERLGFGAGVFINGRFGGDVTADTVDIWLGAGIKIKAGSRGSFGFKALFLFLGFREPLLQRRDLRVDFVDGSRQSFGCSAESLKVGLGAGYSSVTADEVDARIASHLLALANLERQDFG